MIVYVTTFCGRQEHLKNLFAKCENVASCAKWSFWPNVHHDVRKWTSLRLFYEDIKRIKNIAAVNCNHSRSQGRVQARSRSVGRRLQEACVDRECYPSPLNYYQVRRNGFLGVSKVDVFRISFSRPPKIGTNQSAVGLKQLFVSHICWFHLSWRLAFESC